MHTRAIQRVLLCIGLGVLPPMAAWSQPRELGDTVVLRSEVLDQMRTVYVGLPSSYHQSRRSYPVLYLLDANWHFPIVVAQARYLSECRASDIIAPEFIVVGIENIDRDHDFTPTHVPDYKGMSFPTSGGATEFLQFLEQELIPLVDGTYRTVDHRLLAGWSFGGLFTVYAMLERPDLFSAYIGISPSIWWQDDALVKKPFSRALDRPIRFAMTIGADEEGGMNYTAATNFAERFRQAPVDGLEVTFLEIDGAGHNQSLPLAYYRSLRALYSDWLAPDEVVEGGRESVEQHYRELSKSYGYAVPIPEGVLIQLAIKQLEQQDYQGASELFERATRLYPESSTARYLLGRTWHKAGDFEDARREYVAAIDLEARQNPPDGLNLRYYRSRLEEVEGQINSAAAAD
jgi:predicted alpha/beta superfamily hydrolase